MSRYAIVDADGNVTNVVVWDGQAEWDPGQGRTPVELADDARAEPGGRHDPGGAPEWVSEPDESDL